MANRRLQITAEVEIERGMEPSNAEIARAVKKLLTGEQIHVHVVKGREFGGSRVEIKKAKVEVKPIIRPARRKKR